MEKKNNYLTKTIFKKSLNCPTSVYYSSKKDEYFNNEDGNEFLKALGEGGYQVEYLAKDYYPQGIDMYPYDFDENIQETKRLIEENENIVLFEPLFVINGYLVRVDVLEKVGNTLQIREVKAKGFDFSQSYHKKTGEALPMHSAFLNGRSKKPVLNAAWSEYLYDVAFQKIVLRSIYPEMEIESYLFMLDKNAKASIDGLHQKYLVKKDNTVEVTAGSVGEPIMDCVQLDDVFDLVGLFDDDVPFKGLDSFGKYLDWIKDSYQNSIKLSVGIGSKCAKCPFYVKDTDTKTKKNGYTECWEKYTNQPKEYILDNPTVLDIWNYRAKDKLIGDDVFFINETKNSEIYTDVFDDHEAKSDNAQIFDAKLRQLTQVNKVVDGDNTITVFEESLKDEMDSWVYPLNMIDFETSASAIPFSIHVKSYESIAFQFSHHVINEDGSIEHISEYLHTEQGSFPSFDFVRALKKSLEQNEGSIFMFSPHENSILNHILRQLHSPLGKLEKDKDDLISFIKDITKSNERTETELNNLMIETGGVGDDFKIQSWVGKRCMIDLWKVYKELYYNPLTNGSNSIKYILPAVLESSTYLKDKYSKPIYGTDEIPSMNFKNKTWLTTDNDGKVINPYKQLDNLTTDGGVFGGSTLNNGGDAMTAFARLQFTQMDESERDDLIGAMLRYCELDTFSMCLIVEHWMYDILKKGK